MSHLPGKVWDELTGHVFINQGDELRLQDGRWVSISARPLLAEPGKIILITDITETRKLQDVLNRQQRLTSLGEMVASLAHQVRTPLASALLDLSNITHPDVQQAARLRFAERAKGSFTSPGAHDQRYAGICSRGRDCIRVF